MTMTSKKEIAWSPSRTTSGTLVVLRLVELKDGNNCQDGNLKVRIGCIMKSNFFMEWTLFS